MRIFSGFFTSVVIATSVQNDPFFRPATLILNPLYIFNSHAM